jgi:hypothetical protein
VPRYDGVLLFRDAERQNLALEYQQPPRGIRLEARGASTQADPSEGAPL